MDERGLSPEKDRPIPRPNGERDSRRKEASRVEYFQFALAIRSESETGANIFLCQIRKFPQNIRVGHTIGQILQDVINGDAESANARFAAAFPWFHSDDADILHISSVPTFCLSASVSY